MTGINKGNRYNNFGKNIQNFRVLKEEIFACHLHFNNVIIVKMERMADLFHSKQKLSSQNWHNFKTFLFKT